VKLSNIDDQLLREFAISHAVSGLACLVTGSGELVAILENRRQNTADRL
jgi:hypothetical protein